MQNFVKVFCTTCYLTICQKKGSSIFLHERANSNAVERRGILLCYKSFYSPSSTLNLGGSQIVLESDFYN